VNDPSVRTKRDFNSGCSGDRQRETAKASPVGGAKTMILWNVGAHAYLPVVFLGALIVCVRASTLDESDNFRTDSGIHDIYTDQWAARIEGGESFARDLARRHGFVFITKV